MGSKSGGVFEQMGNIISNPSNPNWKKEKVAKKEEKLLIQDQNIFNEFANTQDADLITGNNTPMFAPAYSRNQSLQGPTEALLQLFRNRQQQASIGRSLGSTRF